MEQTQPHQTEAPQAPITFDDSQGSIARIKYIIHAGDNPITEVTAIGSLILYPRTIYQLPEFYADNLLERYANIGLVEVKAELRDGIPDLKGGAEKVIVESRARYERFWDSVITGWRSEQDRRSKFNLLPDAGGPLLKQALDRRQISLSDALREFRTGQQIAAGAMAGGGETLDKFMQALPGIVAEIATTTAKAVAAEVVRAVMPERFSVPAASRLPDVAEVAQLNEPKSDKKK